LARTEAFAVPDQPIRFWGEGAVEVVARTFVLSFAFTGSIELAGSIAIAEMATKMALHYLHERAWSAIHWNQSGNVPVDRINTDLLPAADRSPSTVM
jgi:uncharacterized membrane protein